MSEPVSNSEIEDVLSSIRRLIAESPGSGEQGRTSRSDAPDKLVLTPAFRVLEPEKTETEAAQTETTAAPQAEPTEAQAEAAQQSSTGTGDAGMAPEEAADETAGKTPAEGPSELEQRIAELEAAIGESYEEWEPDGSEFEESPAAATMPHPATEAAMQWQDAPEPYDPATDETAGTSAATMILEAEEITDEEEGEEGDSGEGGAGDSGDAAHRSAAQTGANDESGGSATADEADEEDILIDEEALRELVAQLVREQLRGQIGERITRSIRRMVRREIRLALAVRDTE